MGFGEGRAFAHHRRQRQQRFLGNQIDLVDREDQRLLAVLQRGKDRFEFGVDALFGVHRQQDGVRPFRPAPRSGDHSAVEAAGGGEDAGGVDQHDLRLAMDGDAHQTGAGGLRLGAGDRHFLADQRVDQRRFASVRRADDGDETAAAGHGFFSKGVVRVSSRAMAAARSASCLLVPVPVASPRLWMATATVKRGAWSGPSRLTTR